MAISLAASVREGLGKQKVIKLRQEGLVPGVLYGEGKPAEHICLDSRELHKVFLKGGSGKLIDLNIQKGKKTAETEHVIVKDFQRHPVKGNLIHIDFLRVAMDHLITVKVPVHLVGEEKRNKDGAILETLLHELEISCLPGNIPDRILIDISKLGMGLGIHVKELAVPEGVKFLNSPEEAVVMASSPTVAAEAVAGTAAPEVVGGVKKEEA
jgi:large subunit ribosomal protein L25